MYLIYRACLRQLVGRPDDQNTDARRVMQSSAGQTRLSAQ
jgi:hypothetical protein